MPLYVTTVKPFLARVLSLLALIILSPLYAIISVVIIIDDPGPVLFTQKRYGKDNVFFMCHKFRTMKMSAPHVVPTHKLKNPEQYITRVGRFLRKTSLDELPQFWDVFQQKMVIVGPRPALWNQNNLIAEREKYEATKAYVGITGLAQIRGRDAISIRKKAKYDGAYWNVLKKGGIKAFLFDCRLLLETVISVASREGVLEGGTGRRGI